MILYNSSVNKKLILCYCNDAAARKQGVAGKQSLLIHTGGNTG